jgi:hypothetical protein
LKRIVKETFAYLHEVDGKETQSLKSLSKIISVDALRAVMLVRKVA